MSISHWNPRQHLDSGLQKSVFDLGRNSLSDAPSLPAVTERCQRISSSVVQTSELALTSVPSLSSSVMSPPGSQPLFSKLPSSTPPEPDNPIAVAPAESQHKPS